MSEIENLTNCINHIQNLYDEHNRDETNDGSIINLIVSIFDYIKYDFISSHGFQILNMDFQNQERIYRETTDELEQGRCRFRASLFLTLVYHIYTLFIGLLHTAETTPITKNTEIYVSDDKKRALMLMLVRLHEVKENTTLHFPTLHDKILKKVEPLQNQLTALLKTFDDDSAILYNQEKRRIFKAKIFGDIQIDLPDNEELQEMKKNCHFTEAFNE